MKLKRYHLEIFDENKRDVHDRRKKCAWAVFSYQDENGIEYRRSFTAPSFTTELKMWDIAPKEINL